MPRSTSKGALERLQERIRTADRGWFFAAVADQVARSPHPPIVKNTCAWITIDDRPVRWIR